MTLCLTLWRPICVPSGDKGDTLSAYDFCQPSNLVQVRHLREEDHLIEADLGEFLDDSAYSFGVVRTRWAA